MSQFWAFGGLVWVSYESISGFWKQFGPQDVGGGYLVNDFGALGVNFGFWDLILSIWEFF